MLLCRKGYGKVKDPLYSFFSRSRSVGDENSFFWLRLQEIISSMITFFPLSYAKQNTWITLLGRSFGGRLQNFDNEVISLSTFFDGQSIQLDEPTAADKHENSFVTILHRGGIRQNGKPGFAGPLSKHQLNGPYSQDDDYTTHCLNAIKH
jgi:hypothetical protein